MTKPSKVHFTHNGSDYEAEVSECRDSYGTGDSPTTYEIDWVKPSGQHMSRRYDRRELELKAIAAFKGM